MYSSCELFIVAKSSNFVKLLTSQQISINIYSAYGKAFCQIILQRKAPEVITKTQIEHVKEAIISVQNENCIIYYL